MTAKEFLRQYYYADQYAKKLQAEYEQELELIDAIPIPSDLDGMPHGTGISRPAEDKAIRLADKARAWQMAQLDAIEVRQRVFELIRDIPGPEGDILIERYLNFKKWEEVCVTVHLSWRQTHRLHAKALGIVAEKMA